MEKPAKPQQKPQKPKPKPNMAAALRANLKRRKQVTGKAGREGEA